MGQRGGKRNEKAVVGIALSRKKDSLLAVNEASFFLTGIDIARIFNSFFFERQQCVVWKLGHNLGFVRDPFLLVRAQLPIWDTTCAATITMAPSDRQDKKPKDASPLTLNSTEKLCQPLYLTLSACPIPLLVNMHASNTHKNTRPRAFDSLLCRVLYYAMMEWHSASPEKQNTRAREAHTSRHASLSGFKNVVSSLGRFHSQTTSQSSIKSDPRQQNHPGRLFHLVDHLRLISYFPSLCGCVEWSTSNPVRASRDIKTTHTQKKNLEQNGSFVWPARAQPVVEHKTFQCGTNWVCVAHKSSSPPETQFCK